MVDTAAEPRTVVLRSGFEALLGVVLGFAVSLLVGSTLAWTPLGLGWCFAFAALVVGAFAWGAKNTSRGCAVGTVLGGLLAFVAVLWLFSTAGLPSGT